MSSIRLTPSTDAPRCPVRDPCVPRTSVTRDRQGHLAAHSDRRRDERLEPGEQRQLRAISHLDVALVALERGHEPDGADRPAQLVDAWPSVTRPRSRRRVLRLRDAGSSTPPLAWLTPSRRRAMRISFAVSAEEAARVLRSLVAGSRPRAHAASVVGGTYPRLCRRLHTGESPADSTVPRRDEIPARRLVRSVAGGSTGNTRVRPRLGRSVTEPLSRPANLGGRGGRDAPRRRDQRALEASWWRTTWWGSTPPWSHGFT